MALESMQIIVMLVPSEEDMDEDSIDVLRYMPTVENAFMYKRER